MSSFSSRVLAASLSCMALAPAVRAAEPTDSAQRFSALTAEAEAAYARRDYNGAIASYLAAYEVIASADVLYNVAFIYEDNLGKRDLARNFYERIVRSPDSRAELVKLATERLAAIDKKDAEDKVRPTIIGTGPGPTKPTGGDSLGTKKTLEPESSSGAGPGPWILVATGGAMIIGGIVSGVQAFDIHEAYHDVEIFDEASLARARDEADKGRTAAAVSDVLIFGGGAVVVGGLVWYFLASSDAKPAASGAWNLRPSIGPSGLAAELELSF